VALAADAGAPASDREYAAFLGSSMGDLLRGVERVTYAHAAARGTGAAPESVYVYQGAIPPAPADGERPIAGSGEEATCWADRLSKARLTLGLRSARMTEFPAQTPVGSVPQRQLRSV